MSAFNFIARNPALILSSLFSEMGETWVSIQYLVKNSILVGLGTQASLSDKRLSRDRVGLFCKMDQTVVSTFVRHCEALRYSLQFTFHLKIIDRFKKCNLHHWMLHWVGNTEYSHSKCTKWGGDGWVHRRAKRVLYKKSFCDFVVLLCVLPHL